MTNILYHECLGQQIFRIRKSRSIRQTDLSDLTSLSRATIRAIEDGQGNISSFNTLVDALGLVFHWFRRSTGVHVGEHIASLRKGRQMSQRALAAALSVSRPTIIKLENGGTGRLATLNKALSFLDAKPRLLCRTEQNRFHHVAKSSASDEWYSPTSLLTTLTDAIGSGFDLDPCSPTTNPDQAPVPASRYYTVQQDGLSMKWTGCVYMNPPYSKIKKWAAKARLSADNGDADFVLGLLPARTDTKWWHEDVAGFADVFFLRRRLTFSGHQHAAPFPSAVVVWGGDAVLIGRLRLFLDAYHMPSAAHKYLPNPTKKGSRKNPNQPPNIFKIGE